VERILELDCVDSGIQKRGNVETEEGSLAPPLLLGMLPALDLGLRV
jgi:hypothetical protein